MRAIIALFVLGAFVAVLAVPALAEGVAQPYLQPGTDFGATTAVAGVVTQPSVPVGIPARPAESLADIGLH